jgi:hypothetical protein
MMRGIGVRDHRLGLTLCGAYVAVLLSTASAIGLARDEREHLTGGVRRERPEPRVAE